MAVWAVSDVHGCYTQFQHLLDKASPGTDDEIYILGDVIDRGPKPVEMLRWCIDAPPTVHTLLGNHEDMAGCVVMRDPDGLEVRWGDSWVYNGGEYTRTALLRHTDATWRRERLVPWLEGLEPYASVTVNGKEFMLVHAGFDPTVWDAHARRFYCDRLDDSRAHRTCVDVGAGFGVQEEQVMVWARDGWIDYPGLLPAEVVFGHTRTSALWLFGVCNEDRRTVSGRRRPVRMWHGPQRHAIDCGCAYGGRLGMLRLDDMAEFYVPGRRVRD